eukprot:scaffold124436_cov35-Tisochrysis_lutea.AAC.1
MDVARGMQLCSNASTSTRGHGTQRRGGCSASTVHQSALRGKWRLRRYHCDGYVTLRRVAAGFKETYHRRCTKLQWPKGQRMSEMVEGREVSRSTRREHKAQRGQPAESEGEARAAATLGDKPRRMWTNGNSKGRSSTP